MGTCLSETHIVLVHILSWDKKRCRMESLERCLRKKSIKNKLQSFKICRKKEDNGKKILKITEMEALHENLKTVDLVQKKKIRFLGI